MPTKVAYFELDQLKDYYYIEVKDSKYLFNPLTNLFFVWRIASMLNLLVGIVFIVKMKIILAISFIVRT